jgi:hypothetical protein
MDGWCVPAEVTNTTQACLMHELPYSKAKMIRRMLTLIMALLADVANAVVDVSNP